MRLKTPYVLVIAGLLACPSTGSASDRLKIENIADGDNVVVVMDSRTSTNPPKCSKGEVLRTTGELAVGNVPEAGGCNSEIAVFAKNNAMNLSTPVWTNNDGEIHTITMRPIINVPVTVWIAHTNPNDPGENAQLKAPMHVAHAGILYRENRVGVQFMPRTFHDVFDNATAVATIGNGCNAIGAIRNSAWYRPNTLNIYYVKEIRPPPELHAEGSIPGLTCDRFGDGKLKGDANIIFISVGQANLATLAHEIGHAFGLRPGDQGGHSNDEPGFDKKNIMWGGGGEERNRFSLGQVFRMNTQHDEWGGTMLIANGWRPGPGRTCPPRTTSAICPPLALDWSRP